MGRRSGAARGRHCAAAGRGRTAPAQPPEGAPVRGLLRRGRGARLRLARAGPALSGPQQAGDRLTCFDAISPSRSLSRMFVNTPDSPGSSPGPVLNTLPRRFSALRSWRVEGKECPNLLSCGIPLGVGLPGLKYLAFLDLYILI